RRGAQAAAGARGHAARPLARAPVGDMSADRLFTLLLALFPRDFRDRFGDDMRDLFHDQMRGARARAGKRGVARLWLRVLPSIVRAALLERGDSIHERWFTAHTAPRAGSATMLESVRSDLLFAG